jgi:hypothetical protein
MYIILLFLIVILYLILEQKKIERFKNFNPKNINKKYKVCFIHIPKTGGTTIELLLFNRNKDNPNSEHLQIDKYHKYYNYFIFSFVRNPYTRIISVYNYYKNGGNQTKNDKNLLNKKYNINNFLNFYNKNNMKHLQTQFSFLQNSKYINYTAKFENFEKELNKIFKIINFKHNKHIEQNRKMKYINYIIRPELINKINKIYKEDFENYGYKMININKSMKLKELTKLL